MRALGGVRGRVMLTALVVSAVLYSAAGTLGFLAVADGGRRAAVERINEVLDGMVRSLRAGTATVRASTPDGVEAFVVGMSKPPPAAGNGEIQVQRQLTVDGAKVVLVGRASNRRQTESLRTLYRGLWLGVPLAVIFTAAMAGLATGRALRPVGAITELAASIGAGSDEVRVPVPDTGDEIEQLAKTVNGMLGRIGAGIVAQREFTSDAAHELRTPLMALQAEIELAQRQPDSSGPELLDRLFTLAQRLGARVEDLVLLSVLDEAPALKLERLVMAEIVRSEAAALATPVVLDLDDSTVEGDPALVARAVRNLLANAQRHARTSVGATVSGDGQRVWLHVDDDGPGIAPDDRTRVFRRFSRLDAARASDAGGAGLGLAIVATVAERHHGEASVGTAPLGGARVSVWLPAL